MAPTPRERGVSDRGVEARAIEVRAGRPPGYASIDHAEQVYGMELGHRLALRLMSKKDLIAKARAKHEFLVHHSDELKGTAAEKARAQSYIAETLLAMKDEAERRMEEPQERPLGGFGPVELDGPEQFTLLEAINPFMNESRWQEYVIAPPRPKRRRRRRRPVPPPAPEPERKADPIFIDDGGTGVIEAAESRLRQAKDDVDDLMKDTTDTFSRISFVLDYSATGVELLGVAGLATFGGLAIGTGMAATGVLLGVATSMGQGVQLAAAGAQKRGFILGYRYFWTQLKRSKGKGVRVKARRAWKDIWQNHQAVLAQDRLTYSLSDGEFYRHYLAGVEEAAQLVNSLADIADEVTRAQFADLRKKYTAEELQELFYEAAHRNRLRLYREVKKRLKFR